MDDGLDGPVGKRDLHGLRAIIDCRLDGQHEHDRIGIDGLKKKPVALVSKESWSQVPVLGPVGAPFGEHQQHHLVEKRHLQFGELPIASHRVPWTAQETIYNGQTQARRNI